MDRSAQASERTIALVEDEELLRGFLAKALERAGYVVVVCRSAAAGQEALDAGVDLIVADVVLPDGSGVDVARRAADAHPPVPVVAMSGASTSPEAFELGSLGVRAFLKKPFEVQILIDACQTAIDGPPSLAQTVRSQLPHRTLADVEGETRDVLIQEAEDMTAGNRTHMARVLGMTREGVQQVLRARDPGEDE